MPGLRVNIKWMLTIAQYVLTLNKVKSAVFGGRKLERRAWGRDTETSPTRELEGFYAGKWMLKEPVWRI